MGWVAFIGFVAVVLVGSLAKAQPRDRALTAAVVLVIFGAPGGCVWWMGGSEQRELAKADKWARSPEGVAEIAKQEAAGITSASIEAAAARGPSASDKLKMPGYIRSETEKLRARLRDPASAQFSGTYVAWTSGAPIVCGYVNSKNGFGGYTGRQRFIGASAAGYSITEEDMASGEMDGLWAKAC